MTTALIDELWPWLTVLAVAAVTYFWRALGVLAAGRMPAEGPVVRWVACVSYAMLAGLFSRMILIPTGQLADVPLAVRLIAVATAVTGWLIAGRNVFIGACAGVGAVIALTLFA